MIPIYYLFYSVPEANGVSNHGKDPPGKASQEQEEFTPPDGGYGWLVCFASFWVNGTVFGLLNTFGILLPKFSELAGSGEENITTKVCKYSDLLRKFAVCHIEFESHHIIFGF